MGDNEIIAKAMHLSGLGTQPDVLQFARAILASHTAKLLAGVDMPESVGYVWCDYGDLDGAVIRPKGYYTRRQELPLYSADQLQQYAAAAAAQAREKALDEAKGVCVGATAMLNRLGNCVGADETNACAAAIEKLKGGE